MAALALFVMGVVPFDTPLPPDGTRLTAEEALVAAAVVTLSPLCESMRETVRLAVVVVVDEDPDEEDDEPCDELGPFAASLADGPATPRRLPEGVLAPSLAGEEPEVTRVVVVCVLLGAGGAATGACDIPPLILAGDMELLDEGVRPIVRIVAGLPFVIVVVLASSLPPFTPITPSTSASDRAGEPDASA